MGPLVPLLFLIPIFLAFAWLFDDTVVIRGVPVLTVAFAVASVWILFVYIRQYNAFVKNDPDRLQSEEYRYEMARMQTIAAKDLPFLIPEDRLSLPEASENPAQQPSVSEDEGPPDSTVSGEEKAK